MVSEKWLCGLWRQQRWARASLATRAGQSLQVIYAGRQAFDHGPDFRDALLVFGDDFVRGDVEVHVRTGDWRSHGHQGDGHYDRVVLHVVWRDDGAPALTSTSRPVPVLVLEEWVGDSPMSAADPPDNAAVNCVEQTMPCFLRAKVRPAGEVRRLLAVMGEERLANKAAVFEAALTVEEPAQVFYGALLEALGYATNRAPFCDLARILPWQVVAAASCREPLPERTKTLEALFLGSAGLLPAQRDAPSTLGPDDAAYAADLERRWSAANALWQIASLPRRAWRFARVRPENFPPRRLAAAAYLLASYVATDLPGVFLGILRSEEPEAIAPALEAAFMVPALGYWATHHDFGGRPAPPTQLLGRSRAADVAINVVLPFAIALAEARNDPALGIAARGALRSYPPLAENELTRYMSRLVFGPSRPRGLAALDQQGLLHAYHRYCREKRCGECPLG